MRSGAVQGRRGYHERIGREVHGGAALRDGAPPPNAAAPTKPPPAGEGECEKAIAAPPGAQSTAGPLTPAPTSPPTGTSCGVSSGAPPPPPVGPPATSTT